MTDFDQIWIDLKCPNCNYEDTVQIIDVKTEKNVFCNNCKIVIKLIDNEASTKKTSDNIQKELNKINDIFKK